jgi:pimeloyl-ACP methyl ester carboxylesterase
MTRASQTLAIAERSCRARPALLLVHGSLASGRMWTPYLGALSTAGELITVDLHGYGASPEWPGSAPMRLADGAALLRRACAHRAEPVHVIAHSFGGAVALRWALENPERIESLTLIEPACFFLLQYVGPRAAGALAAIRRVADGFDAARGNADPVFATQRFYDFWNSPGSWSALSADRQRMLLARHAQVGHDFTAIFAERFSPYALRRLRQPTLIVTGSESPQAALLAGGVIADAAPEGSSVSVAGAGHMLPITHPTELTAILRARLGIAALPEPRAA